jgi:glutamine synthetase
LQERVERVGAAMARLVHSKAALLLATDVRASATRAAVWRAQQCLAECERLAQLGVAADLGEEAELDRDCLEAWCRAAAADMLLLEALRGAPLAPLQPIAEVLPACVAADPEGGAPRLLRPAGRDVAAQLVAALAAARGHASGGPVGGRFASSS